MKLIKISAFVNPYQWPIIELSDCQNFVLAAHEDLAIAATVWFDYAAGQEFKISAKAIDILMILPTRYPGGTAMSLAKSSGRSQRTVERYLDAFTRPDWLVESR
ncbi:MAG TPA: hypothetical protein PLI05_01845 [Methanotrichaceae archaeon]|nr:hypothetical protein [Methanotrichaceae archaeon]HQF15795.1 hypothetical protein [Methanotrichaceae archaeon]HQI90529.1 hypothetical protein [Methanotrichaceae archaeon]